MELRGFDSYSISLGDEMRGERASLGKSLLDVEGDLRIKAHMLTAIEDCDLSGFQNQSVIAGYVRSYARYLGMDAEDCYERFCQESGYRSPAAMIAARDKPKGFGQSSVAVLNAATGLGSELAQSRFAAPPTRNRFQARVSMGALTSSLALAGLIFGLGYGGYALLQDIQRVGFAPLPEAPVVVADAPLITTPDFGSNEVTRPAASDYADGGLLAVVAIPTELPDVELERRDGPISAIDPETSGIFAYSSEPQLAMYDSADDAIRAAEFAMSIPIEGDTVEAEPEIEIERGTFVIASETAWIRVSAADRTVLFEGMLQAGERFDVPPVADAPVLKAGNAGGVFILIDGVTYGPVGERGQIARDVSLVAESVRSTMAEAESLEAEQFGPPDVFERAEAALPPQ